MDTITYSIPGDGKTTIFPIKWPYIHRSYVRVSLRPKLDDTAKPVAFTWLDQGRIEIFPAPAADMEVIITRETPADAPLVSFYDGSTLTGPNLNTVSTQLIHIVQEGRDYTGQVHDYVLRAEGMLEQLGGLKNAVNAAEGSAERAEGSADKAEHISDELKTLSIAVDDAPAGHMASGSYNAETGMLTLRVPPGPDGKAGRDGRDGTNGTDGRDGKDGEQGSPGIVIDLKAGMFALEVINGDLILFHNDEDGAAEPSFYLDTEGHLVWEQS